MKIIGIFLTVLTFSVFNTAAFAYSVNPTPTKYHPPACNCPLHANYYGYNFPSSMFDYEVDTACVDFCIDKEHTVEHCMHVCSRK